MRNRCVINRRARAWTRRSWPVLLRARRLQVLGISRFVGVASCHGSILTRVRLCTVLKLRRGLPRLKQTLRKGYLTAFPCLLHLESHVWHLILLLLGLRLPPSFQPTAGCAVFLVLVFPPLSSKSSVRYLASVAPSRTHTVSDYLGCTHPGTSHILYVPAPSSQILSTPHHALLDPGSVE